MIIGTKITDRFFAGQRFRYTYYDKSCGDIWQSIEKLDKMVRNIIYILSYYIMQFEIDDGNGDVCVSVHVYADEHGCTHQYCKANLANINW